MKGKILKNFQQVKAINKHLTIEIEYTDKDELRGILTQIQKELGNGKNFNRQVFKTSLFQYRKSHLTFPDYREEKINGKWCMVYPSKMNNKHK